MEIKLGSIAGELGITHKTLACFLSGAVRTELTARKLSDYAGLPWKQLQGLKPADVEALLVQAYLDRHFPWLKDIKKNPCDYENSVEACA